MKHTQILMLIGLGVLVALAFGMIYVGFTSTSLPTRLPTLTPPPSPTWIPKTPTPRPTPLPIPTRRPTSVPAPSASELTYLFELAGLLDAYIAEFEVIGRLCDLAGTDSSVIGTDWWTAEAAWSLAGLEFLNEEVRALNPPRRYTGVHGHMLDVTDHIDRFVTLFVDGIGEIDADKLEQAAREMLLATDDMNLAIEELRRTQ